MPNVQGWSNITPPLCLVFNLFNPGVVSINFVQYHLMFFATARPVWELPCLVCIYFLVGLVHGYEKSRFFASGCISVSSLIICVF